MSRTILHFEITFQEPQWQDAKAAAALLARHQVIQSCNEHEDGMQLKITATQAPDQSADLNLDDDDVRLNAGERLITIPMNAQEMRSLSTILKPLVNRGVVSTYIWRDDILKFTCSSIAD